MIQTHDLDYFMNLNYKICLQQDSGGWFAEIEALPGCMTYANTRDEVLVLIEDAKRTWIEDAIADGDKIPEPTT